MASSRLDSTARTSDLPRELKAPSNTAIHSLLALLCLIWGSTWIVIQGGLADLPVFTSAGARFLLSASIMTIVAGFLARREGGEPPPFWLSFVVGATNFGISYGVVYWSESRLPSGIVSLLWAVFPMMTAISGHFFLRDERLHGRAWIGLVLGLLGVALLFRTDLRSFGSGAVPAALVLLISPLVSTIGTTLLKRHGAHTSSVLLNRNAMWIGAALLCGTAAIVDRDVSTHWTMRAIASVLYLSIIGTVVAFGIYFWLLRHAPAQRLSLISYVTPAIALSLGGIVGKEKVTIFTLAGSALILCGVALVVRGKQRTPSASSASATTRSGSSSRAASECVSKVERV